MALTRAFYEAVETGNVRRVRIMMKDSLLVDPSFKEFMEMEKVAISMQGLYDSHDGRSFEINKDKWDDSYMDKLMVQVVSNFSRERLEHIKDVVRYLRPASSIVQNKASHITSERKQYNPANRKPAGSYEEQKRYDQQQGRYIGAKYATGTIAGAVVGGVIASAAGVTVIGGAVTGAVAGGVVVSLVTKGGR